MGSRRSKRQDWAYQWNLVWPTLQRGKSHPPVRHGDKPMRWSKRADNDNDVVTADDSPSWRIAINSAAEARLRGRAQVERAEAKLPAATAPSNAP
jgi:hypothetical protein